MTAILVTALLIGYAVWLTQKLLPALERRWSALNAIAKREVSVSERHASVAERQMTLDERKSEKPVSRQPMPADLEARINGWEDEFAREDERKYVEQLYAETGDWDAVRRAYAPTLPDNQPEMQVIA